TNLRSVVDLGTVSHFTQWPTHRLVPDEQTTSAVPITQRYFPRGAALKLAPLIVEQIVFTSVAECLPTMSILRACSADAGAEKATSASSANAYRSTIISLPTGSSARSCPAPSSGPPSRSRS